MTFLPFFPFCISGLRFGIDEVTLKNESSRPWLPLDLDLLLREDARSEKFCLLDRGLPDNLPLVSALAELFSFQELLSVDPLLERSLKNLDRERFSSLKIKWDSIL